MARFYLTGDSAEDPIPRCDRLLNFTNFTEVPDCPFVDGQQYESGGDFAGHVWTCVKVVIGVAYYTANLSYGDDWMNVSVAHPIGYSLDYAGWRVAGSASEAIDVESLATCIATLRAQRAEARALRRELSYPPLGHSVAVWQAYLAHKSEFDCYVVADGKHVADRVHVNLTAVFCQAARNRVETGEDEIPPRILRHAGQLYGSAR